MDADRFDAFVRSLPFAVPRRAALSGLLGTGLAALLGRLEPEDAAAKRKKKRRKKKRCRGARKRCGKQCIPKSQCCRGCGEEEQCCNGACIPLTDCCGGCDKGQQCCAGACISKIECCGCAENQLCCDGTCADCCSRTDCPAGADCQAGVCVCATSGDVICGDSCADLATDGANCGECGFVCPSGACVHGACTCDSNDDCSAGCECDERNEGGVKACTGGSGIQSCSVDSDCVLGLVCLFNGRCSKRGLCRDTP